MLLVLNLPLVGLFARIAVIKPTYLVPCLSIICLVGIYSVRNSIFDVWVMIAAGIIGFFLRQWALPIAPFIIGMVLGPTTESSFRQTLMLFKGNMLMVFDRPVALGFVIAILLFIAGKIVYQIFCRVAQRVCFKKVSANKEVAACGSTVPYTTLHLSPRVFLGERKS